MKSPRASRAGVRPTTRRRGRQQGAVALAVVVLLYAAVAIAVVFVHRSLVLEQRAAANLVRAAVALEAAEAGLEWATVRLRAPSALADDCLPASVGTSFVDAHLALAPDGLGLQPVAPGRTVGACVAPHDGGGWRCRCAEPGAALQLPTGSGAGFAVAFEPRDGPRVVDVVAQGCTRATVGPICTGDAQARLRMTLALRPALAATPGAALTVRGAVATGSAALGVHNADAASGGVALRAGADVDAPALRVGAPAGSPPAGAVVARDSTLAAAEPARLFQALFGVPRDTWRESFADDVLACPCDAAMLSAALARGSRKLWLRGDLAVAGPATVGTELAPVVVVVDGAVRVRGALQMRGLLYAADIAWQADGSGPASPMRIDGAVVSESGYRGDAAPDLVYDPRVIARLQALPGSFVRVPGSWRDDTPAP